MGVDTVFFILPTRITENNACYMQNKEKKSLEVEERRQTGGDTSRTKVTKVSCPALFFPDFFFLMRMLETWEHHGDIRPNKRLLAPVNVPTKR